MKIIHSVGQPLVGDSPNSAWPCNLKHRKTAIFPEEVFAVQYGTSLGIPDLVTITSSTLAQAEGWISTKGSIFSISGPQKVKDYVCAIMPSGCGKTSLAMMMPSIPGWQIGCVSDTQAFAIITCGQAIVRRPLVLLLLFLFKLLSITTDQLYQFFVCRANAARFAAFFDIFPSIMISPLPPT